MHMFKTIFQTFFVCFFLLSPVPWIYGQLLLTIDVSDITNISFTATSNSPLIADNSFMGEEGFTLIGLIEPGNETDSQADFALTSNLTTDGIGSYTEIKGINFASLDEENFEVGLDIWVYRWSETNYQNFSLSLPAFTGTATIDLFGNNIVLKSSGGGDIYLGGAPGRKGAKIGEYQVIPEPSTLLLVGLGLAGMAFLSSRFWRHSSV